MSEKKPTKALFSDLLRVRSMIVKRKSFILFEIVLWRGNVKYVS